MSFALAEYFEHREDVVIGADPVHVEALLARVFAVAEALAQVPRGARVVVACRARAHLIAALFGAWQAGRVVELPTNSEHQTMQRLREDPAVHTVLHDEPRARGIHVPSLAPAAIGALRTLDDETPLVSLHTSGTTAAPQRFEKSARTLLGEALALFATFAPLPNHVLCTVPPQHLYGLLFGILLPLRAGRAIVDDPVLFPDDVANALLHHDVGVLVSTPAHLRTFVALPRAWPRGLMVLSSGAPLAADLHARLHEELGWTVHDVLGSTETGGIATRHVVGSAWRPLAGVQVHADADGTMQVRSAWSSVEQSSDRVRVHADGGFDHLGRADDIVKVGGKRVDLKAVEAALRRIDGVRDAAVIARDDALRGVRLCAFVAGSVDALTVRTALAAELDALLLPRPIRVLDALPREPSGKLRRERLLALLEPAQTPEETQLTLPARYFEGHFPGAPILPGAALVAEIVREARRRWPELGAVVGLRRIRFQRALRPGDIPQLRLIREAERVRFTVRVGEHEVSSGRLEHLTR